MKPLKFSVLTDTHYFSKKNWIAGNCDDFEPENGQLLLKYSEEIVKDTFNKLCDDEEDIILIGGDLTYNGEYPSHEEMRALLLQLQSKGKQVYVITATHDYDDGFMPAYGRDEKNNPVPVESPKRSELLKYYSDFGYHSAIAVHKDSMSYVAQLSDGYRLLALNDDYGNPHCGFSDDCLQWIKEQVQKAKADGQFIFALTHHPIIPPSVFYKLIGPNDMMNQHEMLAAEFADMGIPFIFTGHSHIHNISCAKTEKGNVLYDISTAALTGYPPAYRKVCIYHDERKIDIKSCFVNHVAGIDTNGLTLTDYMKNLFLGSVADAIDFAENDYEKFKDFAVGISVSKETSQKYKFIIQRFAKFLNHLTFGKVWKFVRFSSGVSSAQIKPIYTKRIVPFVIDIVSNLYKGDADIQTDSVEYKIAESVLKKADKLSKPFSKKLKTVGMKNISSAVLPFIHKDGTGDADAVLKY